MVSRPHDTHWHFENSNLKGNTTHTLKNPQISSKKDNEVYGWSHIEIFQRNLFDVVETGTHNSCMYQKLVSQHVKYHFKTFLIKMLILQSMDLISILILWMSFIPSICKLLIVMILSCILSSIDWRDVLPSYLNKIDSIPITRIRI